MAFKYDLEEGKGMLFVNDKHQKGDKLPCLKGAIKINGQVIELAIWAPREGKKAYAMKVSQPRDSQDTSGWPSQSSPVQQDMPF